MKKKIKSTIRKLKYDFAELKKQFFDSEYDKVTGFFQDKFGVYNSHINNKTIGWTEEKKKRKLEIVEQSLVKAQEDEVNENAKALKNLLVGIRMRVGTVNDLAKHSVKDLQRLFDMLMPLNGKPTKFIKSDNTTKNINIERPLTEEQEELLKKALKEVGLERDRK